MNIGFVYAIGDETGRVKIGWSRDPIKRLTKINTDCSSAVTLLGVVPALRTQEMEAHTLLAPWRVNREWYRHQGPVAAFVSMLAKPKPRRVGSHPSHPLRVWCRANGRSVQELADLLGVDRVSVYRWLKGTRTPRRSDLSRIKVVTGIRADELLEHGATP